jgi:hypothetical protein
MACYIEQVHAVELLSFPHTAAFLCVTLLAIAIAYEAASGPVSRVRLERFARRQQLTVTATNGNQVLAYLATTRRWRAAGMVVSFAVSVALSLLDNAVTANFLTLFIGWFVGALIAEVRVAHLGRGDRQAASLSPRRPTQYVSRFDWYALVVALVLSLAAAAFAVLHGVNVRQVPVDATLWFAGAVVVLVAVRAMQIRVLRRPQPLAEPDVIAADDAIRSRSLHVLTGGAVALVAYCAFGILNSLDLRWGDQLEYPSQWLSLLSICGIPIGWQIAMSRWRVRRPLETA